MAVNGADVLLLANVGDAATPDYQAVGSQRDVTFNQTNETIDAANKTSGRYAVFLPGRYNATIDLTSLYVPNDIAYGALQQAARLGLFIIVRRRHAGTDLEEADAFVTSLSESFPDQEAGEVTTSLQVSGPWRPVVAA